MTDRFVTPCELPNAHEREILNILIEECAEVQQRATKFLRFGKDQRQPGQAWTNSERLAREVGDLSVMVEMAIDAGLISAELIESRKTRKREKLARYMQTSATSGAG